MKNQAFKVSVKYEKVQGQKLNMKKTKGLFVGRLRGNCSRFKKNCMGHRQNKSHGYNINTDTVWKTIINKMKSCHPDLENVKFNLQKDKFNITCSPNGIQTWKKHGIPERYKNEIIWDDKVNQTDQNLCCLDKKEGGMGMINIENSLEANK